MHCTRKSSQLDSRTLASSWRNEAIHINLFGLRIELRFVDKPSQLGIPSHMPLPPIPLIPVVISLAASSATQNLQNSFMQMKCLL